MSEWATIFTAFGLGLLSSAHCVGMCGGIMGALTMAIPASAKRRRWQLLLSYNFGRIGSYTLMGLLLGFFAGGLSALGGAVWLRVLAGVLLIAMGLYLANWWRGLVYLERVGKYFWAYLQPLGRGLMPVSSVSKAFALGMLWGWLPCGLVYSALVLALAATSPWEGAMGMVFFGLGTLPVMLVMGLASGSLLRRLQTRGVRSAAGVMLIVFGLWQLLQPGMHGDHHEHHEVTPAHPMKNITEHPHHGEH